MEVQYSHRKTQRCRQASIIRDPAISGSCNYVTPKLAFTHSSIKASFCKTLFKGATVQN